jgi:hypothetical protein
MDERLRAELLSRQDEDQRVRRLAARSDQPGRLRISEEHATQWQRVDDSNSTWLARVVAEGGWPGRSMVGDEGASAAWLLAQHADRQPQTQHAFLDAMRAAVADGEASPAEAAYLEDRVRKNAGLPQIYGTQFTVSGDGFGPYLIDDPENLDRRRAAVGLEPFADYEARMRTL